MKAAKAGVAFVFTWRRAICESGLPPTCRHVAWTLSGYMDAEGGSAFPSVRTLAEDTGLSERVIRDSLRALVRAGLLTRERRFREEDGAETSSLYRGVAPRGGGYHAQDPLPRTGPPTTENGTPPTTERDTPPTTHGGTPPSTERGTPPTTLRGTLEIAKGGASRNPPYPPERGEGDEQEPSEKPRRSARKPLTADDDPDFLAFWAAYPLKTARATAFKSWLAHVHATTQSGEPSKAAGVRAHDPAAVIAGLARWRAKWDAEREPRVPWASTWLNQERWDGDVPPVVDPKVQGRQVEVAPIRKATPSENLPRDERQARRNRLAWVQYNDPAAYPAALAEFEAWEATYDPLAAADGYRWVPDEPEATERALTLLVSGDERAGATPTAGQAQTGTEG